MQQKMYDPQVNDYVRWTTELGMVHEGGFTIKVNQMIMQRELKINGWQHLIT